MIFRHRSGLYNNGLPTTVSVASVHVCLMRITGPDISEEKAERARSLEMVLQQAEEERARRVAHDAKGEEHCRRSLKYLPAI